MDGYNPFKGKAPDNPEFFPYGKPGGGAPLRDDKGRYQLQRRNIDFAHELDTSADITRRRKAADEYLQELSELSTHSMRSKKWLKICKTYSNSAVKDVKDACNHIQPMMEV